MSTGPRILFHVQHLLGIGHVFRATRIARALARAGASVHLVWGGTRLPSIDLDGLEVTFLPPVRSDSEMFAGLVHPDGTPFTQADQEARRDQLLALFDAVRPDAVITEAFPFGRRQVRFELVPLMQAARAAPWRPLTIASIRDIMQEGRAESRVAESLEIFRDCYDLLLVHGDPQLIRIEETLQGADMILDKVRYTGLVTPDAPDLSVPPSIEADVVVSAGGGAVGHALMALFRHFIAVFVERGQCYARLPIADVYKREARPAVLLHLREPSLLHAGGGRQRNSIARLIKPGVAGNESRISQEDQICNFSRSLKSFSDRDFLAPSCGDLDWNRLQGGTPVGPECLQLSSNPHAPGDGVYQRDLGFPGAIACHVRKVDLKLKRLGQWRLG